MTTFTHNDHGWWCPSCGDRLARASAKADSLPEKCHCCGFPDPDEVAAYHMPEDADEEDQFPFDCGLMPDGTCQLAGTEECDWECPHS